MTYASVALAHTPKRGAVRKWMRMRSWMIAASVLLAAAHVRAVKAQTAGEMLQACEMLQRGMHVEGETVYIPPSAKLNQCWGFIEAVQQYAYLADQNGKTWLNACPTEDSTTVDVLHIFVDYLHKHPEKRDLKAAAAAYNAMADAFPCK